MLSSSVDTAVAPPRDRTALKVLYLVPYVPVPGSPGPQGPINITYSLLSRLQYHAEIDLVMLGSFSAAAIDCAKPSSLANLRSFRVFRTRSWISPLKGAGFLLRGLPYVLGRAYSRQAWQYIRSIAARYDVVMFDHFLTLAYRSAVGNRAPVVVLGPDAYSLLSVRGLKRCSARLERVWLRIQHRTLTKMEKELYGSATVAATVSPVDARHLVHLGLKNVAIVPPTTPLCGIMERYYHDRSDKPELLCLVQYNGPAWARHDAFVFVQQTLPHIRSALPDIPITLWGPGARDLMKSVQNKAGVYAENYVPDYANWFLRDWVYLCPCRTLSGVLTRLLDAMTMALPVVGYCEALAPFESGNNCNYVSCHTGDEFVEAVTRLVAHRCLRRSIGESARKMVLSKYNTALSTETLLSLFVLARDRWRGMPIMLS